MLAPSIELQEAIVSTLKGSAEMVALIDYRVYDRVPPNVSFPYVSIGPSSELADDVDCIEALDISQQIDVWSRAVGAAEAKQIASVIRTLLNDAALTLNENALVYITHVQTDTFRDADGLTTHSVLTFSSMIEQP